MTYHYNLRMVHSGPRTEIYYYSLAQQRGTECRNKNGRKGKKEICTDKFKNRQEVLYRARNNIIRLVNCNPDLTAFITLTYADNVTDIALTKQHLHKCLQKLQRTYDNFKYIYVLEYQKRMAIHYHMLCNYPVNFTTAHTNRRKSDRQKEAETQFMHEYWDGHGFVDIRDLKQEGNTNAGLYVSTYIVKSLESVNMDGRRVYGYSRNLKRPQEETMLVQSDIVSVLQEMHRHYNCKYGNSYSQIIDYGNEVKSGNVNYFDFWRRLDGPKG